MVCHFAVVHPLQRLQSDLPSKSWYFGILTGSLARGLDVGGNHGSLLQWRWVATQVQMAVSRNANRKTWGKKQKNIIEGRSLRQKRSESRCAWFKKHLCDQC